MKIVIEGQPIAKMRHRNRGKFYYDPQSREKERTKEIMAYQVQKAFEKERKEESIELFLLAHAQAFIVTIFFYLGVPNSNSEAQKNAKLWGFDSCNTKPDLDNLEKFYLDCANKILFDDDRLVVEVIKKKMFSLKPRTEIIIMPLEVISNMSIEKDCLSIFGPQKIKCFFEDISHFIANLNHPIGDHNDLGEWLQSLPEEDRSVWIREISTNLLTFSDNWADDLKKIKKLISKDKK